MVDPAPQFETEDLLGSTAQYAGTVGTAPISVPTAPGPIIAYAFVRCATDNSPQSKRLSYSFDGGTTFAVLSAGEYVGWPMRGSQTQIVLKGNSAGVAYEVLLNREPT
jgi:hypothetical protein